MQQRFFRPFLQKEKEQQSQYRPPTLLSPLTQQKEQDQERHHISPTFCGEQIIEWKRKGNRHIPSSHLSRWLSIGDGLSLRLSMRRRGAGLMQVLLFR